jgi:serine/threonine protein phosphatase 1
MVGRIWQNRARRLWPRGQTAQSGAPLAPGLRLYAIGDVHGRLDLLERLFTLIEADIAAHPAANNRIILLGDYVDRGAQSREVVERLMGAPPSDCDLILLKGNHEDTMLRFLDDRSVGPSWLRHGGWATLASYDIAPPPNLLERGALKELQTALRAALPVRQHDFLAGLPTYHVEGSYLFVHAGIRPGVPLGSQVAEDLFWIRDEFLDSTADHGFLVVHGHSITPEIERKPNRIGIDTGAYVSGILSCLVLEADQQRFLRT